MQLLKFLLVIPLSIILCRTFLMSASHINEEYQRIQAEENMGKPEKADKKPITGK